MIVSLKTYYLEKADEEVSITAQYLLFILTEPRTYRDP